MSSRIAIEGSIALSDKSKCLIKSKCELKNSLNKKTLQASILADMNLIKVNTKSIIGFTKCSTPGILLIKTIPKIEAAKMKIIVLMTSFNKCR